MDGLFRDVRFAIRSFLRAPVFSASLLLTLGLALAAAITTFGVLDAVLARPLPLDSPERAFVGWARDDVRGTDHLALPVRVVDALPERVASVEAVGGVPFMGTFDWLLEFGDGGEEIAVAAVTGDFFGALGAKAVRGELPREFVPSREELAPLVLSHAYWQRRFGGAAVLGRILRIDGRPYQVRAVAPEGLRYPKGVEAWAPLPAAIAEGPVGRSPLLDVVVRLDEDASAEVARAELEQSVRALFREWLGRDASRYAVTLRSLMDVVTGDVRPWLRAVGLLVAVLLAVATLNATVLLLIRGLDRARETAIRIAAGATRRRLLRQMATENLILVVAACALALALAAWGLGLLRSSAPPGLPRAASIGLDPRVAAFAGGATLAISGVLSIALALAAWRRDPARMLRTGARSVGPNGARLRDGLVVGQIAMTVVVLGAAGMLGRSLYNLSALEAGFAAESLVLAEVALPERAYADAAAKRRAFRRIVPAVAALPGVRSASGLLSEPFPSSRWAVRLTVEGQDPTVARDNPMIDYEAVDGNYFATLSPRVVGGRGIRADDRAGAPPVVVINRALAELFWSGRDPVGGRLKFGSPDSEGELRTVAGVVDDMRYMTLERVRPTVYFHYDQGMSVLAPRHLAIRTAGAVRPGLDRLRRVIEDAAPGALVLGAPTMEALLRRPLARPRFHVLLLGCFAITALVLTAAGVYGTLGTTVRQRRSELAVRLALGARPGQLRALVLRRAAWMAALGAVAGAVAAVLALRTIASLFYGVAPEDPATFAAVTLVILAAAAAAAWIPARTATATDPNHVLRHE